LNDELAVKLLADLEKSGMHSELVARNVIVNKGWMLDGTSTYFDRDEGKSREFDVAARRPVNLYHRDDVIVISFFHLFAEVKKSERPWIVFKRRPPHWSRSCAWNNLTSACNLPCKPSALTRYLQKHSLIRVNGWEGIGIHEAFKKPDQPSRWYSAFVSACKAADWYRHRYGAKERTQTANVLENPTEFFFLQPLVILDGQLVSAELSPEGKILLEEVTSAAFKFGYQTDAYEKGGYRVDLVTLTGLPDYLELQRKRHDSINFGLQKHIPVQLECRSPRPSGRN
jgi:hypothetical protein